MVGCIVMHSIKLFMVGLPGQPWSGHVHPPFYQPDALPARRPDGQAPLSFSAEVFSLTHRVPNGYSRDLETASGPALLSLLADIFSFTHRVPINGHSRGRCYLGNSSPLKILLE